MRRQPGSSTSRVTCMRYLFIDTMFNDAIGSWDTRSVTDMHGMFFGCYAFDQDIGGWDTSSVTDMEVMFYECHHFNQDLSEWDTHRVSTMQGMFEEAASFHQNLDSWCLATREAEFGIITDTDRMF
mmetsp:Transcript_55813/g.63329  ORF Transcript_55813/g.63329 Transcript_55813/m.63329 type:complete len:126 (+) Transcript_55813:136-513(+)